MKILKCKDDENVTKVGRWQFSSNYGITKSPNGKVLLIEPRLSKLLYFLSLNINTNVSRPYLVEHIWNDTIVNEESLTRAVSDLRKLLFENFKDGIQIETLRGRGYRLTINSGRKIDALKAKLNPNLGYTILGVLCFILLLVSIGSALGLVETKFLVKD